MESAAGVSELHRLGTVERVLRVIDAINAKVGLAVSFLFIPIGIVTVTEVVARYVFKSPTIFAWDLNSEVFAVIVILAAGYTQLQERHTRIDAATVYLSSKAQTLLDAFSMLILIFVAVVIIWQGTEAAITSFMGKETIASRWSPPIYPIKMFMPLGGFLLLIQGIAKFARDVIVVFAVKK